MCKVGLVLQNDRKARAARFMSAAKWWSARARDVDLWSVYNVDNMVSPARNYSDRSITTLALFCHGIPYGFGCPGVFGVDVRPTRFYRDEYISHHAFAETWGPKLAPGAVVSLGACLCSRNPNWYLIQLFGYVPGSWGVKSYQDGGCLSVAARLAGDLPLVEVRGHCAAGDTINQALIRSHDSRDEGGMGRSLFGKVMGEEAPLSLRRKWQKRVKGPLAASYLLDLPGAYDNIVHVMSD